jgi:hypothetical protein
MSKITASGRVRGCGAGDITAGDRRARESRGGEAAHADGGVGVRNCAGERVRGVGRRRAGKPQQPAHHFLHLFLRRLAVPDHRLLHLQRRVFGDRQPACTAAAIAVPRACPRSSVDCGLTLTNTFSTATSVGARAR